MAGISWIKLRIDMFDDEKIKIIQSMPEGDALLVIWIRLIALAGKCNANGLVLVEDEFPYSDEMLSVIFAKPLSTVRLALKTFEKFHMIETTQKGIYITNFDKHQNVEGMDRIREQNRVRKQRERDRKKALRLEELSSGVPALPDSGGENERDNSREVTNASRDNSREVTQQREDKEKEEEIYNISSDEDIVGEAPTSAAEGPKPERLVYNLIMDDYNNTCIDLPKIRALSDARKRSIRTLLNELENLKLFPGFTPYEKLHQIFTAAQESDFLSGRNKKWDGCSFDWLLKKANVLKVLEGNYKNKGGVNDERNTRNSGSEYSGPGASEIGNTTSDALERFRRNNAGSGL